MLSQNQIALFSYISFNYYATSVLGSGYTNAQVLAILDADTAKLYGPVAEIHANVYPSLPAGTPNDYTAYPYLKLRLTDGNIVVAGLPWIVDASYVVNQTQTMTIVLQSISPDDQNNVKAALSAIGLSNFTVTLS